MEKLINRIKKDIAITKKENQDVNEMSWGMQKGILISCSEAEEILRLYKWKKSATKLLDDLRLQEIAKEIELKLGQDIVSHILPFIKKLKSEIAILRQNSKK